MHIGSLSLLMLLKYLQNIFNVILAAEKYGRSLVDAFRNNIQYIHGTSCSLSSSLFNDISHRNAFIQQTQLFTQY